MAQAYETRKVPADTRNDGGTMVQGGSDTKKVEASSSSFGSTGIFGKLQKTMDKTMQKMEKQFEAFTGGKAQPAAAPPGRGDGPSAEAAQRGAAAAAGDQSAMRAQEDSLLSAEDRQLQWALNASLAEAGGREASGAGSGSIAQEPALEEAATQAAAHLQLVEERAHRAEQMLAQATVREAAIEAERLSLRKTLDEHEGLIKGLTEQLDALNSELDIKKAHCRKLEADLEAARLKREAENADMEREGTISQLLARISELESTLLQATHFAPDVPVLDSRSCKPAPDTEAVGPEAGASAAAIVANSSPERVPEEPLGDEHLQDPETALPFVHDDDLQAATEAWQVTTEAALAVCGAESAARGSLAGFDKATDDQLDEPEEVGDVLAESQSLDSKYVEVAQSPEEQLQKPATPREHDNPGARAVAEETPEEQPQKPATPREHDTPGAEEAAQTLGAQLGEKEAPGHAGEEADVGAAPMLEAAPMREAELDEPEAMQRADGEKEGLGGDEVKALDAIEAQSDEPEAVESSPEDGTGSEEVKQAVCALELQLDPAETVQCAASEKQGTGSEEVKEVENPAGEAAHVPEALLDEPEPPASAPAECPGSEEVEEVEAVRISEAPSDEQETSGRALGERLVPASEEAKEVVSALEVQLDEPDTLEKADGDVQGIGSTEVEEVEKRTGGVIEEPKQG